MDYSSACEGYALLFVSGFTSIQFEILPPFGLPPPKAPPMIVKRHWLIVSFPCCHKLGADYLCFVQSSPLEKGLSQQELLEALTGRSLKTPEGSKHQGKVQGDGGHGQSSDADSHVAVTTPEQVESRWSTPGAAAHSVRGRGQRQRSASTNI